MNSSELRLQLSQQACEACELTTLTVGLLQSMQPRDWDGGEVWGACTLKELGNQRSQRTFPLSEKAYYLFKMVMVGTLAAVSSSDVGRSSF